ncbi:MAG: hypothetical protein IAB19_03950 [Proteobacteria bacterium]|uniref:Uncharacterized protein n=1 Tax=Candidatus Avisuccinivibrio stercorigallinarum TaxID=2840704 RepID=A0A9D9D9V8_9GAMM|nr:hypothetical protein [Candidatus Avisuccinivibrio stercorigallinarum]
MTRNHSFEPRTGKAQFFFGICYGLIALIAVVMAVYVKVEMGTEPYMQYFMAALFGLLTVKSFYLYSRVKKLIAQGTRQTAKMLSCESVRGITVVRARTEIEGYGPIEFEQRLAGVRLADEIKRVMAENKQSTLPCIVIAGQSRHPRAMLTIATDHGRLKPESIAL